MLCQRVMVVYGMLLLIGCSSGGGSEPGQQPITQPPPPVQSLVPQAYVKASNTTASDFFGGAIALDGNTMVVGVQTERTGALNSGAVYVFVRNGTTWTQQAFLKAPTITTDERFGRSVALSGDTLVVGAPAPPNSATGKPVGSGSVYVYTRSGTTWTQQADLKASNAEVSDRFGSSVALDANTLVVGASGEDSTVQWVIPGSPDETATRNGAIDSGAVYVFTRANEVWTQQAYVKAANAGEGDGFGNSVALAGDTFVVGAESEASAATGINGDQEDNSASSSGAVYVFTLGNNGWVQEAYVKASNTGAGDRFGWSVALVGNTLTVGAPFEDSSATGINSRVDDNNAPGSGAVYLFTRVTGSWRQEAYVKALNAKRDDNFGSALGLTGGILVVGAPGNDSRRGTVYVFAKDNGIWTEQISGRASNADANDNFGGRVALSGSTIAVGAIGESSNATGVNGDPTDNSKSASGAAYIYMVQ